MTPFKVVCLVIPFLIAIVVIFIVQSDIYEMIKDTSLISIQNGDASNLILVGFSKDRVGQ